MPNNLYIRWNTAFDDHGARPVGSDNWWSSPSLRIVQLTSASVEVPNIDPAVAEANNNSQYIAVRVDSAAVAPQNVVVQAWVRSFGPTGPWIANGVAGLAESFNIATGARLTASAGAPATAYLKWSPTPDDIGGPTVTEAHACILANCYTDSELDPDGAPLASGDLVTPVAQKHHAQRNITLVKISSLRAQLAFSMAVTNPFAEGERLFELELTKAPPAALAQLDLTALGVVAADDERDDDHDDDGHGPGGGHRGEHRGHHGGHHGHGKDGEFRPSKDRAEFAFELAEEKSAEGRLRVVLGPERRDVALNVAFPKKPGPGLHGFDMIQRLGDQIVGAATLLVALER
jgi:hypothetical protein